MTSVFIGGSRRISRLNETIINRLDTIMSKGFQVLLGDANGADKAVQAYLNSKSYKNVTVYCSGNRCRNNVGRWQVNNISVSPRLKGREFYTVKDTQMAEDGDYGFMIWDGKSLGSLNNVVTLLKWNKISLVYFSPEQRIYRIGNVKDLEEMIENAGQSGSKVYEQIKQNELIKTNSDRQMNFEFETV